LSQIRTAKLTATVSVPCSMLSLSRTLNPVDTTRHMMFAPLRKLTLVNVCLKLVDTTRRIMFTLISSSAPQAHSAQYVCLSPTPHRHTGTLYANSMKTIGLINNVLQSTPTISSPPPPHSTKCNSPPTNGQRTNIRCLLILEDLTSSTFSQNSVCVVNLSNSL